MQRKLAGYLRVDSGQIFLTDPAYLGTWQHGDYAAGREPDNSYARVTSFMLDNQQGEVEHGIVVGTEGDGSFPVYIVEDERGHLLKVEIDFEHAGSVRE